MARTMVMGVVVNRLDPKKEALFLVSAAVGSYDNALTQYTCLNSSAKKEKSDATVKQLDLMTSELLEEFRKHNNYYPENIFVFRSNITENHLKQVEEMEIPLIRAAIKKVSKNCKLNVIFSQTGENLSYNLASGTVIDRSYKKSIYDVFYLINTQCSSLNTSKSTKYICLLNELKLSSDDLQKFCSLTPATTAFALARSLRKIPIPVRYADLCAYRSKQHIEGQREAQSIEGSSMQEAKEQHIISQLNNWVKIHERVRNRLYYC
ncbi:hypothetical protein TYRP_008485 [Tyrophagus putrescentiae]|nr:hypothetical protein TYRP_008485 [Tyrophagus putrescentiae]